MSSRALRKARREQEEQEQLRKAQEQNASEAEDEDAEPTVPAPAPKQSLFAMLDEQDQEPEEDDDDDDDQDGVTHLAATTKPPAASTPDTDEGDSEDRDHSASGPKASNKRKKKKKRRKGKEALNTPARTTADSSMDEIDLALRSLSTKTPAENTVASANTSDPTSAELCHLLAVDAQHLHAANEMRRLFGRAALESDANDDDNAGGRRRNRGAQQAGLAAAVGRRQNPGGRASGLAALSLRRNLFIQGKEEWPVATGGGLGMEIVEKRADGIVEYSYVHNRTYQDVQGQFEVCVASMDPNRMVQLLQFNPYHISTLLQVSEIAKQERDHATSGDLLERALFSYGRAVHSTFAANLAQGKARLNFRRPENREFWLAACRYIANLGMRATWRTVYEWSKLLLALNPEQDPYRMRLILDQYALRGRQPQGFLEIANSKVFSTQWKQLPNIQLSRALALVQSGDIAKGKQALYTAVGRYPWVVARLFQELNLDPPPGVWGKTARTDSEKLQSELYATRAKDLWLTPEASNLLVEISSAVSSDMPEPAVVDNQITTDEARHVLMADTPALIALLPHSITAKINSASDPLPPADDQPSYTPTSSRHQTRPATQGVGPTAENVRELRDLHTFFADLFPWFANRGTPAGQNEAAPSEEEIRRHISERGIPEDVILERTQRMGELQYMLGLRPEGDEEPEEELVIPGGIPAEEE